LLRPNREEHNKKMSDLGPTQNKMQIRIFYWELNKVYI
jgi:hypothetical protein